MKKLTLSLTVLCCLSVLTGCPSTPKAPVGPGTSQLSKDPTNLALDVIRQAPDAARCREGLHLLSGHIRQTPALREKYAVAPEAAKFLKDTASLTAEEMTEIESSTFRPADAYYVAECFQLRDAARSLEISGLPVGEQARHCFRWVDRHVQLHQHGDDWLTPAPLLKRGYGGARDRALVFLALMRQLQVEGCLFVSPEATDEVILVGVVAPGAKSLYLFDPRLGSAVPTADGKVATLKDVQSDPGLLKFSEVTAEQLKKAQVRLACPLCALSNRMLELERRLTAQDRIVLHLDLGSLRNNIAAAAGLPANAVQVWNAPDENGVVANSPTRALRLFLSPEDGGTDKDKRTMQFQANLAPWTPAFIALEQINLGPAQLPPPALQLLLQFTANLFDRYYLYPHDMLLRGDGQAVIRRLQRARSFLEDENLGGLADDADFQQSVADWRTKVKAAYAALAAKDGHGQTLVNNVWGDDAYLLCLLDVDDDQQPQRFAKKTLTRIVAHACRESLNQRALWLRAMQWQEKSERDQLLAGRPAAGNAAVDAARKAWINTRVAWTLYLDRAVLGTNARHQRREAIRTMLKRSDPLALQHAAHLMEALHLDLHQHYAARFLEARAVFFIDGPKAALLLLRSLDDDVAALLDKGKNNEPAIKADLDTVLQRLGGETNAPLRRSLELMRRDWAPHGNFYWLRQRVQEQIGRWEKA